MAPIVLRSRSTGMVFCQLVSSMFDFQPKEHVLRIHYLNARISQEWAEAIGRPDLAGWVIGGGERRLTPTVGIARTPARVLAVADRPRSGYVPAIDA